MNRITGVGVLISLASLLRAQDLSAKISVDIPASRASVAFAALSKAAGVTLEAAGNLRNEVFVINAHDVTVDELMKRIAQAEAGGWQQEKSGAYLLVRDSSTSVLQERAELKERTDAIRAAVTKLSQTLRTQSAFDQAAAQQLADDTHKAIDQMMQGGFKGDVSTNGTEQRTPTARAIARLLNAIDPAKLAQIGPNQRVVFSTNSTPVQLSLGGPGYSAFRDFVAEQQIYTQAYDAGQPQDPNNRKMVFFNGLGTPSMGSGDPKLGLGVGLVIVQRRFEGGLDVQIVAADPNLATIASGNYMLRLPASEAPKTQPGHEDPLQISADAQEMAKALSNGDGKGGPKVAVGRAIAISSTGGESFVVNSVSSASQHVALSPGLKAKVLNPDKYDPLSFVPGEAMSALARSGNKNLVALLPDECFGSLTHLFAGKVTPSQLLGSLGEHSLKAAQDGDWMVISPRYPATARINTVDRGALKKLLQTMDRLGVIRLDDAAEFALAETKVPGLNDFDILYPRMINDGATDHDLAPLAYGSFTLYKFYGSLSSGQRQALASGRQLSFSGLSSQQTALIADMLYNSPMPPNVQVPPPPGRPATNQATPLSLSIATQGASTFGVPVIFGGASAATERTIVVPNGVPADGYLRGSVSSQDVVQGIRTENGSTSILDASDLALAKHWKDEPEMAEMIAAQPDKFKMAHQSTLSLQFFFNPRVNLSRSLNDIWIDDNAVAVSYDSLPSAFRQKVDQITQSMQRALQKLPGRGESAPPPR